MHTSTQPPGVCGPGVCGPGVCGPGVCGPGVCGPGVCGSGVCGPGVCGPGVCGPGVCGPGAHQNREYVEGAVNWREVNQVLGALVWAGLHFRVQSLFNLLR